MTGVAKNMRMTVAAPAKINLFLEITGKRNDGYHLINTVMQTVSLYDDVTVALDDEENSITLSCTDAEIPCDSSNTAYKAAEEFFSHTGIKRTGVNIRIKKRIPSGAGMAGGSTDAAAVIYALNELTDAGLDTDEMAEIGEKIGADVPFCIYGGTMTATGIGTIFTPLPDMPDCFIVAVKPDFKVSTREAYEKSDALGYERLKSPSRLGDAVCSANVGEIGEELYNKFEEVINEPEIDAIKQEMKKNGASGAIMTGSGSVVFGIFDDEDKAKDCCNELSDKYENIYTVHPVAHGQRQINTGFFGSILP